MHMGNLQHHLKLVASISYRYTKPLPATLLLIAALVAAHVAARVAAHGYAPPGKLVQLPY